MGEFFRRLSAAISHVAADMRDPRSGEIEVEWDIGPAHLNLAIGYWAVINHQDPVREYERWEVCTY